MIREAMDKVVKGKDLTRLEMRGAFAEIMNGSASPAQISAFITALRMKRETVDEITAAAEVMRRFASTIDVRKKAGAGICGGNVTEEAVLDTCGTGGSGANTFNISTTAAFVAAGCGVKVAKHGNRSASSRCGSADVLEKLGVSLSPSPREVQRCVKNTGIGFMFAPLFHNAMKYAAPVRKEIGIRTIFNILGPLANPANATCQVLGVYEARLTAVIAGVLGNLGLNRAFVVHGLDTLDEISITGATQVSELRNRKVKTYKVTPEQYGLKRASMEDIKGGGAGTNAKITISILEGKKGPCRDAVVLNAAYALVAAEKARHVRAGIKMARESIDSGAAMEKLNLLRAFSGKKA